MNSLDKPTVRSALDTAADYIYSAAEQLRDAAYLLDEPEPGPCWNLASDLGEMSYRMGKVIATYKGILA